jgi:DNA-directed RNA polymerase specialized sigma24 family protein
MTLANLERAQVEPRAASALVDCHSELTTSFERLHVLARRRLFRIVPAIGPEQADAQEVFRNVFLTVWRRRAQFVHVLHLCNAIYRIT